MSRQVFGPVPSRRLGFSLGVDPIPRKYCNFDCIYCQVGRTACTETERKSFFDPEDIVREVLEHLHDATQVDVITFSGSGEPTLNQDLGWMLREVKKGTDTALAVITNSSLLSREDVCDDLLAADIVLPSLDAVQEKTFRRINRPHPSISIESVVAGLRTFRKIYKGKIWLEIMFAKGINDTADELQHIREVIGSIPFEKIQLNTITRPAPEHQAKALDASELATISETLGGSCEVICGFDKRSEGLGIDDWVAGLLATLARRAMTLDDVARATGVPPEEARKRLRRLEAQKVLRTVHQGNSLFYVLNES